MRKALVIGSPGSGKSVFSRKLAAVTGLPLIHLDRIWHLPDGTHRSREEFDSILEKLLSSDNRILDGHYARTLERRLDAADTVFLFDLPTEVCLAGVTERAGKEREDMPGTAAPDADLLEKVLTFRERELPRVEELLADRPELTVIRFSTREQAERWPEDPVSHF